MAELVYLKNALGNSQAYTVENGVKLSDGVGGWVPFTAGGGNVIRKTGTAVVTDDEDVSTEEEAVASICTAVVSVTVPAGSVITEVYAMGYVSGVVKTTGGGESFVSPTGNQNLAEYTTTVNQDGTTTVTAHVSNSSGGISFIAYFLVDAGGKIGSQAYVEVTYI